MNISFLTDIFFPSICLVCGVETADEPCCALCRGRIEINNDAPADKSPFHAAARYDNPVVRRLIWQLKFNYMRSAALPLARIIAEYAARCAAGTPDAAAVSRVTPASESTPPSLAAPSPRAALPSFATLRARGAVFVPVPLSRRRERQRGFNQSALIADQLCALTGIPVAKNILTRVRHAKPHSETTSAAERENNIRGAFKVRGTPPKTIILIDDVVTTGSTFREAELTLRATESESVRAIIAIAVARS